jgi:hypothetical protein
MTFVPTLSHAVQRHESVERIVTRNARVRVHRRSAMMPKAMVSALLIAAALTFHGPTSQATAQALRLAAAPPAIEASPKAEAEREPSPEEKMQRRFPQPVRVGDLVGLPVLDWLDSTIGYVRQVVRTPDGKIRLIVPYGRRLGWVRYGGIFDWQRRPVAVPLEVVAILGRQLAALDMSREEFDQAPTWTSTQDQPIPPNETIRIAITRR